MADVSEDGFISANGTRRLGNVAKGYTYFENGDVLVARITPCMENGKAALVSDMPLTIGFGSTEFHVLRPRTGVCGRYLFYMVWNSWFRKHAERNMTGTAGQKRVPASFFDSFAIPLPASEEQQRIAVILDKANAICRKRRQAIETLSLLKESQFHQWLTPLFESTSENDYVPVSSFVQRFEGGLNLATPDSPSPETKAFILKVSAVTWGDYRQEECKPLPSDYAPPREHYVRNGDLLFSRANTTELVGATAYVFETQSNRVLPDKLWRFVWHDARTVEPLFVWALFNHPRIRYEIGRRATGTSGSMKNVSMEKVLSIRVPWPDADVRHRFARFLASDRTIQVKMTEGANGASRMFESLVHKAFQGEL